MQEDRHFVTALARGLSVLRCFTQQRTRLGTTEIAQLTGLPQPTVWRLCHTLVTLGYLMPVRDQDKLRVGAPVLSLGYAALAELSFVELIRPHLQVLADRFSSVVALAERHRLSMIYLARCDGNSVLMMSLQVGSRIPIYNSAVGWAYLAGAAPDVREDMFEKMAKVSGSAWKKEKEYIDNAIKEFAAEGFVTNCGIQHPDVGSAATVIRSVNGKSLFAMNCAGPSSSMKLGILRKQVGPALVALAAQLHPHLQVP